MTWIRRGLWLLLACACACVSGATTLSAKKLRKRVTSLESRLRRQGALVERLTERTADLERYAHKEFEVLHYNVLANHSGTNKLPWFCYGANVTAAEREAMHVNFYAPGPDGFKQTAGKGWPTWAEGVLAPERIRAIEEYDERYFQWDMRKERLYQAVRSHRVGCREREPDIITLAECDCYNTFWKERLKEGGFQSVWRKRPRSASADGCCIAYRSATFQLVATGGYDFGSHVASR